MNNCLLGPTAQKKQTQRRSPPPDDCFGEHVTARIASARDGGSNFDLLCFCSDLLTLSATTTSIYPPIAPFK